MSARSWRCPVVMCVYWYSGYGCPGGAGAMSGGGENAQFGATAAMVAAATTAAMQDSQPFSQVRRGQKTHLYKCSVQLPSNITLRLLATPAIGNLNLRKP